MFKGIINYFRYRRIINQNIEKLEKDYNIKIDNINRMGTIVSMPDRKYQVLREYKNSELDIHKNLDQEVTKYISSLDRFFMTIGISELTALSSAERRYDNGVEVIIVYKLLDIPKIANIIRFTIGIFSLTTIASFLFVDSIYFLIANLVPIVVSFLTNLLLFKKLFV